MKLSTPASPLYLRFLQQAVFVQALLLVFTGLCISPAATFVIVGIFAHFAGICIIVCRRPGIPTNTDVLFFRYGCVWIFAVALIITPIIQGWLGGRTLLYWWFGHNGPLDTYRSGPDFLAAFIWIIVYSIWAVIGKRWPAVSETLDLSDSSNIEQQQITKA